MLEWGSLEFTLESAGVVPELTDDRKSRAPNYGSVATIYMQSSTGHGLLDVWHHCFLKASTYSYSAPQEGHS
jgi:hypothetical protein